MSLHSTPRAGNIQPTPAPMSGTGTETAPSAVTPTVTRADVEELLLSHRCSVEARGAVSATYRPHVG